MALRKLWSVDDRPAEALRVMIGVRQLHVEAQQGDAGQRICYGACGGTSAGEARRRWPQAQAALHRAFLVRSTHRGSLLIVEHDKV